MLSFIFVLFFLSSVTAFNAIRFSSIQQCGPFNLTFSGTQPTALPLTLTVVPFGSSAVPLSIPLPNPEWDSETSTGVAITFLPYPAETIFVASLDDAQGRSTGFTSDIIRILQSDNVSCISTAKQAQTYTPEPPFSQCQPFNITFDPAQATPPVARLFVPNGQSFLLDQTQGLTDPGTTSFTMVAFRGQPVVLLFRDGSDRLQSTNLLTVTGDVTSSKSCFPNPPDGEGSKTSQPVGLSKRAVIGIVASIASVVTLLSIFVIAHFFLRHKRSGRIRTAMRQKGIEGGPGLTNPGTTPIHGRQSARSSWGAVTIINKPTPYPMEKYTSRPISPDLAQPTSNYCNMDRRQQMQSLNAATADLDRILNASSFTQNDGGRGLPSPLSSPTSNSRGVQETEPSIRTKERPVATIPVSPLSSTSNFRDSIIPTGYMQEGSIEADLEIGDGRDGSAARRSSTTVIISGKNMLYRSGQGAGDPVF